MIQLLVLVHPSHFFKRNQCDEQLSGDVDGVWSFGAQPRLQPGGHCTDAFDGAAGLVLNVIGRFAVSC